MHWKLSDGLAGEATWKKIGVLAVLATLFLAAFRAIPIMMKLPSDVRILDDMVSGYTPEFAYEMIERYGEQGRLIYVVNDLTLDAAFPLIYATFFSLLITRLFQSALPAQRGLLKLNLLPYLGMLADYAENASIITMLLAFPRQLIPIAQLANLFTLTKWAMVGIDLLLAAFGLIAWLAGRLRSGTRVARK